MNRTRVERAEPILNVADMARSVRCYVAVLGFVNADWGDDFAHVSRDDAGIYLSESDKGHPGTWVWIGVEDVTRLYHEYTEPGASILRAPTNCPRRTK